tara:strand:- start:2414 stop:3295 length:882 start_codon:yes stop_codon:yes gene_type:complete
MNRFIKKVFFGVILFSGLSLIMVEGVSFLVRNTLSLKIEMNKNILILGDSQTQFSLNDSILTNSINLSESADTYFYSYVKLKRLIPENPQIDTLFLSYSYHNISKTQDNWLKSQNINGFKFPLHYFLMDFDEVIFLIRQNPKAFFTFYFHSFKFNFGHLMRFFKNENLNNFGIGTYTGTNENKLQLNLNTTHNLCDVGNIDLKYLDKIVEICSANKVKVILIATPIYLFKGTDCPFFEQVLNARVSTYQNVSFYNYSNFKLKQTCFKDASHLNSEGAAIFSSMIKDTIKYINQ